VGYPVALLTGFATKHGMTGVEVTDIIEKDGIKLFRSSKEKNDLITF
jgi:hypothetical protein